jgi:hypothetical protein
MPIEILLFVCANCSDVYSTTNLICHNKVGGDDPIGCVVLGVGLRPLASWDCRGSDCFS